MLYDHRLKLIIGAECAAEELFTQGVQAGEFRRTVSGLMKMRLLDYLPSPHRTEDILAIEEEGKALDSSTADSVRIESSSPQEENRLLHQGEKAPEFSLPDADMEVFDFASLRGRQHAVLFFYPRDGTPYCTLEAADFSDHENEFARLDCVILGVSRDDCLSHADFRDKHGLSVRLLSDQEGDVCRKFGVSQFRERDGHKKLCVIRSTFVIDKAGIVRHALYDVHPKGHAAEVYQLVKGLNGKGRQHAHR